jgi:hypothetical protein
MPSITLKAHFDGRSIQLDEPFEIPPNARLLVTVVEPTGDADRDPWLALSREGLARAYGEAEPEYGPEDLRRP